MRIRDKERMYIFLCICLIGPFWSSKNMNSKTITLSLKTSHMEQQYFSFYVTKWKRKQADLCIWSCSELTASPQCYCKLVWCSHSGHFVLLLDINSLREHQHRQGHYETMIKWDKSKDTVQHAKHKSSPLIKWVTAASLPITALPPSSLPSL